MVYRKNYRRNYRRYGRRRIRRGRKTGTNWGGYISTAGKALALATRVASMINVEFKNYDVASTITPTTTWQFLNLNLIAQGDDQTQRNGRSILAKSLMIRLGMTSNSTATVPVRIRQVIFKDMYNAGSDPSPTQIFNSNSTEALMNITSQQNRFIILMDKYFVVNPPSAGQGAVSFNKYLKLNYHIKFINTSAATASQGPGALYWTLICDNGTVAQQPSVSYGFRLRYVDN